MIAILTSGVALGVHVPGLLLSRRLKELGTACRVDVLESCLRMEKQAMVRRSKQAFHRNFRVALAGQRIAKARDMMADVDDDALKRVLASWEMGRVTHFVILSGFWQPIVRRYRQTHLGVSVDLCHIDSVVSPSFLATERLPDARDIWMAQHESGTLPFSIPVSYQSPVPWQARSSRVLAHGGGWGLGHYADHAKTLAERHVDMDIVAYYPDDEHDERCRYFMIDPDWCSWQDEGFPPFGEVSTKVPTHFARRDDYHDAFELERHAIGILSKPGGGTLLDSLWSATPLIFVEPFGPHERCNAELWQRLGLGVSLEDWLQQDCSLELLAELHRNLMNRRALAVDYARALSMPV